jgi:hypothetical protein
MTAADGEGRRAAADGGPGIAVADTRGHFLPIRKADILDALTLNGALTDTDQREKFRQVCRMLAAIYHYEYFEQLEKLRHAYYYFNPEIDTPARLESKALDRAYMELVEGLAAVLRGANFVEMSVDEIEAAHDERAGTRVAVRAPIEDFREVRFFRRGRHLETFTFRQWFGLKRRGVETLVHDDVVLFVATKRESEIRSRRERARLKTARVRPGSVLIKYFRNIANPDIKALFPNVRVVMSTFDKLFLSVPALAGAVPILLNLVSTITVLFVVIGFYLGITAAIEADQMRTAFAALSGLVALGAFAVRQWLRYQRQSLMYQKELTDNIYFRNVNNNAGIFDYIIGAAEEQECKEAFLAYYFLRSSAAPLTEPELDARIEQWLLKAFGVDIDFEVDDALGKLERLGLLRREGEHLSVPAPDEALARLDYIWDNYFQFNVTEAVASTSEHR